jgi:ABC-type uncharacterized transport system permease subunit
MPVHQVVISMTGLSCPAIDDYLVKTENIVYAGNKIVWGNKTV